MRVAYFIRIPNVGDLLNPEVIGALSGSDVIHSGREVPHLLGIGSLIAWATPNSTIWGTGMLDPALGFGGLAAGNVRALRGKLTHAELRRGGVPLPDVPLGDPGVFGPRLLGVTRSLHPRFRVGLACHHTDRAHPSLRRMMAEDGVVDLNVHMEPAVFLRAMAECETVLSTSLHGLILAEALDIPNYWIRGYGRPVVGDFKFQDWFSTTARPQAQAHVVLESDRAVELSTRAELHECTIDLDALLGALPPSPDGSAGPRPRLSVAACRAHPMPVFLLAEGDAAGTRRHLAAVQRQSKAVVPIVCIIGEPDQGMRSMLSAVREQGIDVVCATGGPHPGDRLLGLASLVARYFEDWAEPGRYVVSECRADLPALHPDHLAACDDLLNTDRGLECAGPGVGACPAGGGSSESTSVGEVLVARTSFGLDLAIHRAGESIRPAKNGAAVWGPL